MWIIKKESEILRLFSVFRLLHTSPEGKRNFKQKLQNPNLFPIKGRLLSPSGSHPQPILFSSVIGNLTVLVSERKTPTQFSGISIHLTGTM